ncbi:hypothetical protein [Streptomyces sp. NPDC089799]|uniref:hypothetical protein n=1 Tax=Streptomyces sp. NPDC089799 TaxID=3155066 RepID=UPI0034279A04
MAAQSNAQGPEGNYDPAGSTQMFRAFVDEGEQAGPAPAAGGRRRQQSGAGPQVGWLAFGVAMLLLVGCAAWVALH